jgi:uncharacterized protein (DUF58 family)
MIPPDVLRELRYLEIATAKKIRAPRLGQYTSPARGAGFEFDQHRPYQPGDDVRRIDWNVTARLNAPYLRQTHAERELKLVLAVDLSRSMSIGSNRHSKKQAMTFITASLLFSAAGDQINTGFLAFSDRVLTWSAPRRASGRAWRILEGLWALEPESRSTALLPALRHLTKNLKTMNVIFLISDFITDEDVFGSQEMRMLASRHDVIAVVVEDPAETALPSGAGFLRVRDPETGAYHAVSLDGASREAYQRAVANRRRALVDACYRLPIDCVFVRSDEPVTEPLLELLARRRKG